ncbi:hypothetical protein CFH99_13940 [Nocardioides aromaticivorans]|uniref:DUF559 domain-containing protein n=1 Tax=Nocardioides aromaticivorans TaxID=200618 RepID=A0ABX7PL78_9ACTN|nr:hypothetical protein [Nocardioides aromaticivorans]QSR26729.1 hypothetical protein CFH99_13940 [Nocardioides aromaticivorans]
MSDEQRYAVRCRAAYQQSCTDVVLSHSSALPFHDAPLWGLDLADVHLTRVDRFSGRREAGICRHRGELAEGDVVDVHGVLVTSPVRAILEVSTLASTESAIAVANHFLNRGDFTPVELRERYEQSMANWPGSVATDLLIRLADPRVESVGESRTMYFLYRHHFPKPVPQYEVRHAGRLVARLDFALPELGIWIEFDGRVKYERHLRPGESPADAVVREKAREQHVAELTGWRCFRIAWSDLADPARLERRLRGFMASVAAERARRVAS